MFTSKYLALFLLTLLLSGKLIAQTITSSITIDQAWVNTKPTPWTISGTVTVTFGENFTITNTNQYFIISGSNVTINGAGKTATISGVTNYLGLVNASSDESRSAIVKNIGVVTQNSSTLSDYNGWISQGYNIANISNCYSTGPISGFGSGGIVGYYNSGNISNCYTTGPISGFYSGGIVGAVNSGTISNCYSAGTISGMMAEGIAGFFNSIPIPNNYIGNGNWDPTAADAKLTGEDGTIWNTSNTPYTLMSFSVLLSELTISLPGASLTSCSGTSSTPTTFGVTGLGLTESVTISAPSGFEISTSEDGFYSSSLTLTNTSTVSQTLFVRLSYSETVGTISGSITATSSSTTTTTTVSGTINAIPSITITESDASGAVNNDGIICNGASATLTASGTTSFLWSSGAATTSSITITPSLSAIYTVTGTTSGCSNTASKTITVNALPTITISGTTTDVDLVTLTGIGGDTYAWSDGSSLRTASNTFDASGLYSLVVSDINSCTSSTLLNIKVQHWGLSSSGAKTLDSAIQINSSGQIGSLNPLTQDGKKSEYKVRIIRDGLVLNLDAGNSSSYPGTGSTWTDLSGNNNHGTLENGPTYSSANGGSIVFDGVNDRVSAFPTQISGTGSKTISLWIKINTTSRTGLAGTRSLSEWGWGFTVNRNGTGTLAFYDTRGSDLNVAAGLGTNIWYNVSVTYDNSRIVTLYVNGLQVGISSTPFAALNASTFNGVIGNEDESFTHPFKGNIAQVAIYNRALTANEVLNNYNALKSRFSVSTTTVTTATNRIWMDRDLGASRVATSSTDAQAYGDLYQWGRGADGHQSRTAVSTSVVASSVTPGNNLYIINRSSPYDWVIPSNVNLWQGVNGVNNPCPSGFRVPTDAEWAAEIATWGSQNAAGAFASPLKLTLAGYRYTHTDALTYVGTSGQYWTSTVYNANYSYSIDINSSSVVKTFYGRVDARSVRCIKD